MNNPGLFPRTAPDPAPYQALIKIAPHAHFLNYGGITVVSTQTPEGRHHSAVMSPGTPLYLSGRPPHEILQDAQKEFGPLYVLRYLPVFPNGRVSGTADEVIGQIHLYTRDPHNLIGDHEEDLIELREETSRLLSDAMANAGLPGTTCDLSYGYPFTSDSSAF